MRCPPESDEKGKTQMAFFPMMLIWSAPPAKFKTTRKHCQPGDDMPAAHKIIIDTDPGQDDAVAILLALASPELEVLGITAVAGNVPLTLTEKNARKICELAGRPDIRVFAGADPAAGAAAGHRRGRARQDRPRRPRPAGADDAAAEAACGRLHRRDADDRAERHGHALRAGAAHQHRAGADPRAEDRRPHQGDRADGRRLLRRRQRHAGRRVQHLCRPACRRRRVQIRRADRR